MAELIQCDRCDETAKGRIDKPEYNQGLGGSYTTKPGGPSVTGWEVVRGGKLFCPACVAALDRFIAEKLGKAGP